MDYPKTITIKNVTECIDTGENEDRHLRMYELKGDETMDASDGYHTFTELYDHRITLFIALAREVRLNDNLAEAYGDGRVWRSKRHSEGELCFGTGTQYVLGINKEKGEQITYHIPIERWDETDFAETLEKAPEWDGHTSDDALVRLKTL